ncbi:hypothetical protein LXL04_034202 [Taraxacum kok-saghyz]
MLSGELRPPPATLAMVADGGGRSDRLGTRRRCSDNVGPARTRCREAFGRAPGVRPKTSKSSNSDSGFVSPPNSTWFLPVCSESRGLQKPQVNFTKSIEETVRLNGVAVRGGCDGVGPFSGVVRPRSWAGFGRGRQGSRAVCSDPTEVAELDGFEVDGGSATGGDDSRFGVVSWLYGEAVVEVWGRSENVRVFPAVAARWSAVVPDEQECHFLILLLQWGSVGSGTQQFPENAWYRWLPCPTQSDRLGTRRRCSDNVGPARTRCREAFGRAPGVRPKTSKSSNSDSGFVSPPNSTWFLPVCSESRGLQKPQVNFTKSIEETVRLNGVAVRGGCDGVGPFSGVVRPRSWAGFGRGRQGSRAVCSDPTEVAELDGFEVDGGSATGGDDSRFGVVSWLYGEAVVEVWGRSENVRVFPAVAARWSAVVPDEQECHFLILLLQWGSVGSGTQQFPENAWYRWLPCPTQSYYITGISDRSLTRVHICVVTEIEGSIPGDTAATTSSQLRRSDRGGFPYDILVTSHHFAFVALSVRGWVGAWPGLVDGTETRPGESGRAGLYDLGGLDSGCVGAVCYARTESDIRPRTESDIRPRTKHLGLRTEFDIRGKFPVCDFFGRTESDAKGRTESVYEEVVESTWAYEAPISTSRAYEVSAGFSKAYGESTKAYEALSHL